MILPGLPKKKTPPTLLQLGQAKIYPAGLSSNYTHKKIIQLGD